MPAAPDTLASLQRRAGNRAVSHLAQTSGGEVTVQRAPPVVAGIGAAIKALTLPEAVSAVGTIVGVAATVGGAVIPAQNDTTGVGSDWFLKPETGDYMMTPPDREGLAQVFRVLYFGEMKALIREERDRGHEVDDDKQEELKQTAIGNVKAKISRFLFRQLDETKETFVANGDGGTTKETPWGSVEVIVDGGGFYVNPENEAINSLAQEFQVPLPDEPMKYIKGVKLSLDCEMDWNVTWNDDIFVRVMSLSPWRKDGHIAVHAEVAFDWDGDTSRYEWDSDNPIEAKSIPQPTWRGPSDPDD
jgi:hypothetical protein